jgi:hypothetical protein
MTRPQPLPAPPARREQPTRPVLGQAATDLTLSPSSLAKYLLCPRRFFLESLLAVAPREDADYLTYGTAVHRFLAELNHRAPEGRTPEVAQRLLAEALGEAAPRFSSPLAADLYRRLAEAALEAYLVTPMAQARTILPERRLSFELRDPAGNCHRFGGQVDVAMELEEGVAVLDYKTGKVDGPEALRRRVPLEHSDPRAGRAQVQLPMYALAWEAQPGLPDLRCLCLMSFSAAEKCKLSCVYLGSGPKPAETLSREDLARFRHLLVEWACEIKTRSDFPGNAPEEGCGEFASACPFVGICDEAELF